MSRTHRCFAFLAALASLVLQGQSATAATIDLSVDTVVLADLPLPTTDLSAEGDVDWALWGLDELPTPGSLTPDASKLGAVAIGALSELNGDPIVDFSQFNFSPNFSWTGGDGVATGTDEPAAMVSRANGVGSGFTIDIAVDETTSQVVYYGQLFQSTAEFTATLDGMTVVESVTSNTPGEFGDTGAKFTIDLTADAPTTLTLRWEMTERLGGQQSVGLSAITVSSIPEPATALLVGLSLLAIRRRD